MAETKTPTPLGWTRSTVRSAWNALLTVYYANSTSWRVLKAGALVLFGFFLWATANILLSYRPGWWPLRFVLAYGFVLVGYGPLHHLVVIPVALRWRRGGGRRQRLGKRLPNAGLVVFLAVVVIVSAYPPAVATVDLGSTLEEAGADIDPDLLCVKSTGPAGTSVHCHLSEAEGVDRVVVRSGGDVVLTDAEPPFEFTLEADEVATVMGREQFTVDLLDDDGTLLRRYTRSLDAIDDDRATLAAPDPRPALDGRGHSAATADSR